MENKVIVKVDFSKLLDDAIINEKFNDIIIDALAEKNFRNLNGSYSTRLEVEVEVDKSFAKNYLIEQMEDLVDEEGLDWNEDYLNAKDFSVPFENCPENEKYFYILLGRLQALEETV